MNGCEQRTVLVRLTPDEARVLALLVLRTTQGVDFELDTFDVKCLERVNDELLFEDMKVLRRGESAWSGNDRREQCVELLTLLADEISSQLDEASP